MVNTISNNIANVNTTAYKKQRTEFEDLLYETEVEAGARSSGDSTHNVGIQHGSGSKVSSIKRIHDMGSPQLTNNIYDLMIMGDGFFGVNAGGKRMFTRDGSFTVNAQGTLQTRSGYALDPGITIPPNTKNLNIAEDGKVEAYLHNQTDPIELGQIPIYTFVNPTGLRDMGKNLAIDTIASGEAIENVAGTENAGAIQQGALESSNVSVMNEMTKFN
jgi:flagellar basal-body rod protein FlgG